MEAVKTLEAPSPDSREPPGPTSLQQSRTLSSSRARWRWSRCTTWRLSPVLRQKPPAGPGGVSKPRVADAPQLWVPNRAGVDFLRLFGRSTRFRATTGPCAVEVSVPRLGKWLTFSRSELNTRGRRCWWPPSTFWLSTEPPGKAQSKTATLRPCWAGSRRRRDRTERRPRSRRRTRWSARPQDRPPTQHSTGRCWSRASPNTIAHPVTRSGSGEP